MHLYVKQVNSFMFIAFYKNFCKICVCAHACVCTSYVCSCGCIHMHLWRPEVNIWWILKLLSTLFFETKALTKPRAEKVWLDWLAIGRSVCLCFPGGARVAVPCHSTRLFHGLGIWSQMLLLVQQALYPLGNVFCPLCHIWIRRSF